MLEIPENLPTGALLDQNGVALAALMASRGDTWFMADPISFTFEENSESTVIEWHPRIGEITAIPSTPNTGNSQYLSSSEKEGLLLVPSINCGFCIPEIVTSTDQFSFAILYNSPVGEARTLLSLNPNDTKNYLFLNEADGSVVFKDQKNSAELAHKIDPASTQCRLVVGGFSKGQIHLSVDGSKPISIPSGATLSAPANLFIGCRSHRNGIVKTLGDAVIQGVLVWPNLNVLDQNEPTAHQIMQLLNSYWLWET